MRNNNGCHHDCSEGCNGISANTVLQASPRLLLSSCHGFSGIFYTNFQGFQFSTQGRSLFCGVLRLLFRHNDSLMEYVDHRHGDRFTQHGFVLRFIGCHYVLRTAQVVENLPDNARANEKIRSYEAMPERSMAAGISPWCSSEMSKLETTNDQQTVLGDWKRVQTVRRRVADDARRLEDRIQPHQFAVKE